MMARPPRVAPTITPGGVLLELFIAAAALADGSDDIEGPKLARAVVEGREIADDTCSLPPTVVILATTDECLLEGVTKTEVALPLAVVGVTPVVLSGASTVIVIGGDMGISSSKRSSVSCELPGGRPRGSRSLRIMIACTEGIEKF